MQKTRQRCYLCNRNLATTKDHVPPKSLFPDPKPSNLIPGLPCCKKCNRSYSMDEEYLRDNLALTARPSSTVEQLWKKTKRSCLRRPAKLMSINKRIRRLNLVTEKGIYVGTSPGLEFSKSRTDRVIRKIIKGLFFYHTAGRVIPSTVRIDDIYLNPNDIFKNLFIRRMFEERKWNDIFYYAFLIERDSIESAFWWLWWLVFYKTNLFIVAFLENTANLPSEVLSKSSN